MHNGKKSIQILFIGNSITRHEVCSYWWGCWGMGATERERDYVHCLVKLLSDSYDVTYEVVSGISWEVMHHDRAESLQMYEKALEKQPNVVILQLGENIDDMEYLEADWEEFIDYIKGKAPQANIIMLGSFWEKDGMDSIQRSVCARKGIEFVDFLPIRNAKYMVGIGAKVTGEDGTIHENFHRGVAVHPNNLAMEYYAKQLNSVIRMREEKASLSAGSLHKIVVVSMVKNVGDVIESFVRHCLSFADEIIVAEHRSSDDTWNILQKLHKEGLPILLERCTMVEQAQGEVITELVYRAVNECGAGIVVPLDGDEFLVNTKNHIDVKEILGGLDSERIYYLPWRFYEPIDEERDKFLLYRRCKRNPHNDTSTGKVIIGASAAKASKISVAQGNHSVVVTSGSVEMHEVPYLHIAHYHFRGRSEYLCKCMVGWLNNVAKYSRYTVNGVHWEDTVNAELEGKDEIYQPDENERVIEPCDLRPYCTEKVLRYTKREEPSWMKYFMMAALDLAEAYAEQKLLRKNIIISILVPFYGDEISLIKTMKNIKMQTYPAPLIEIVILDFYGDGDMIQKVKQEMQEYSTIKHIPCVNQSNLFDIMKKNISGKYCQWLLPGDCLLADKITKMLMVMEAHGIGGLLISDSERKIEVMSPWLHIVASESKRLFFISATWLWQQCMALGKYPYGGIAAVLVHRSIMEQCQWFVSCIQRNTLSQMKMWEMLLEKAGQCAIIKADFLETENDPHDWGSMIAHEKEWGKLLWEHHVRSTWVL